MRVTIPFTLVKIENNGFHPVLKAYFNRRPIFLVIDTGASRTVLHSGFLQHLVPINDEHTEPMAAGINAQQFSVARYRIDTLSIAKVKFRNTEVFGADLTDLAELYRKMAGFPLHGMLGSDFLINHKAQIDFRKKLVRLNVSNGS